MTRFFLTAAAVAITAVPGAALAAPVVITFDDAISGAISYNFDADNDGADDVTFSTTDPAGFNTVGPGPNQVFIDEPGLEGTTLLNPDLRVDFLVGAEGSLSFGFAISQQADQANAVTFSVFDSANVLLGSVNGNAVRGASTFPEGLVNLAFAGVAAYGTFNFTTPGASRYIIDNFSGEFGTLDRGVPEPAIWAQLILGFGIVGAGVRKLRTARAALA